MLGLANAPWRGVYDLSSAMSYKKMSELGSPWFPPTKSSLNALGLQFISSPSRVSDLRLRVFISSRLLSRLRQLRGELSSGTKAEDSNASGDPLAQMSKGGAVLMVCRTCGKKGDHWTSKCPYKDLAQPTENPNPTDSSASGPPGATKGAYVPPTMRPGAVRATAGADMRRRNDENSVLVNNLSEDTREPDLLELFRPFGNVSRVYVAMDQKTGMSRGFGFVNFVRREEGERDIAKLNGYGNDNLISYFER